MAKKSLRFMIVYLHSEEHEDIKEFCRDCLCSPRLLEFIRSNDILLWAGNIKENEAFKGSFILHYYVD